MFSDQVIHGTHFFFYLLIVRPCHWVVPLLGDIIFKNIRIWINRTKFLSRRLWLRKEYERKRQRLPRQKYFQPSLTFRLTNTCTTKAGSTILTFTWDWTSICILVRRVGLCSNVNNTKYNWILLYELDNTRMIIRRFFWLLNSQMFVSSFRNLIAGRTVTAKGTHKARGMDFSHTNSDTHSINLLSWPLSLCIFHNSKTKDHFIFWILIAT
jgi:hypothetical protein